MSDYIPPYSLDEDITILMVIIQTKCFYTLKQKIFWEDMAALGLLNRTWESLQQRFFKEILPNIFDARFNISEVHKRMIILALDQTEDSDCESDTF